MTTQNADAAHRNGDRDAPHAHRNADPSPRNGDRSATDPQDDSPAPPRPSRPQFFASAIAERYAHAELPPELIAAHSALEMADLLRVSAEYDAAAHAAQSAEPPESDEADDPTGR